MQELSIAHTVRLGYCKFDCRTRKWLTVANKPHLVLALAYVFSSLRATRHALHRRELPQASVFIAAPGTEVGTTQVVAWAFPMHVSGREVLSLVVNV